MQNELSLLIASAVRFPHHVYLSVMGYHQGEGSSAPEMQCADMGVQRSQPLPVLGSTVSACGVREHLCENPTVEHFHPGQRLSEVGEGRGEWQPAVSSSQGPCFTRHSTLEEMHPSRFPGVLSPSSPPGCTASSMLGIPDPDVLPALAMAPGRVTAQLGKLLLQMKGCKCIYSNIQYLC